MVALRTDMTQQRFDQFLFTLKYAPNRFQLKVLHSIAFGDGNIIVDAKAGSGKTSLLKMIASLLKFMGVDPGDVLFQAFNKTIEIELNEQLPAGFQAKTSHALGYAMCREWAKEHNVRLRNISDKKYGDIAYEIALELYPSEDEKGERYKGRNRIENLIGKIMANDVDPNDAVAVQDIADHYAIEDITPNIIRRMPDAIDEAIRRFKKDGEMGFIDMIYMPVKLGMQPKNKFNYVLTDESQDLNSLQQEISAKMLAPGGRIIIVGDPNQAIYGFSGADAQAFYNLEKRFHAQSQDLNICYRCPTSHIALAQSIVPTIEAAPGAIEGTIEYKHLEKDLATTMGPGSMVICRLNSPLVSAYFQLIIAEKPAVILGRSIGKNLVKIVEKVADFEGFRYTRIGELLKAYYESEKARLEKRPNTESKIAELADSIECLQLCAANFNCTDVECFIKKLENLFVDAGDKGYDPKDVVTLCTVHKAKGLEADHIGIIYQRGKPSGGGIEWKDIMPLSWEKQRMWEKQQEANIKYVAFTRAKKVLTVFGGWKEGERPDISGSGIDSDMFDLMEEGEEEFMETPEIEEPQVEPILSDGGEIIVADIIRDEPEVETPVIETPAPIDLDALHQRLAWGQELLELTVECLTESQSAEGEAKQQKLSEALIYAADYSKWLNHQNFTLEQCALLVGEQHKFTLKNQHVSGIVETAVGEKKSQDKAIELALSMANNLLAIFQNNAISDDAGVYKADGVTSVVEIAGDGSLVALPLVVETESPVNESKSELPAPRFAGLADMPQPPVESVAWANWLLAHKDDVVILDTETTDLLDKKNPFKKIEIVSIAAIDLDGNTLLNTRIKPVYATINPDAAAVHGITMELLETEGATDFAANWDAIKACIEGKHVVIYNRDFDRAVLGGCVQLFGLTMPEAKNWHCAMLRYVSHNPNKLSPWGKTGGWWKLGEALEQERLPVDANAHDALADVGMTRQLILKLATNDTNKWRNNVGFDIDEIVTVKASGAQMQVVKTQPSGELLLKGVDDPNYSLTVRASMVERNGNEVVVSEPETIVEEIVEPVPVIEEPVVEDKHVAAGPVTVADEPNVPDKTVDPYQPVKDKFRTYKLELLHELAELLQEIIGEKEAELS